MPLLSSGLKLSYTVTGHQAPCFRFVNESLFFFFFIVRAYHDPEELAWGKALFYNSTDVISD